MEVSFQPLVQSDLSPLQGMMTQSIQVKHPKLHQRLRAEGRWVVKGPACRFPVLATLGTRRLKLQSRSGRNHLWFATLPPHTHTFCVPSPD